MKTLFTLIYYSMNLFILCGFLWLAHESRSYVNQGYDHSEFDVLKPHKVVRAQALQSLYYLSNDDIAAPVDLFNEHGRVK